MQVCAATVAYNDPKELARLLSSLTNQGPALNGLIIIDNSTDWHAAENRKIFNAHFEQYPFAHYHKNKTNIGSAGGFCHAMRIAHENSFDWVWLLDQDGVVTDFCLAELVKNFNNGDILCPKVVDIDQPWLTLTYKRCKKNFFGRLYPVPLSTLNCPIDAFGTHGTLVSKRVMDSIGYYDACNFFVGLEDYDYAHRAQQANFVITLVGAAEAMHPNFPRKKATRDARFRRGAPSTQTPEQNAASVKSSHEGAIRDDSMPTNLKKHRPASLGCITNAKRVKNCHERDMALFFSNFYFLTESLARWQFALAFAYSLFNGLVAKLVKGNEICLTRTVNTYVRCFISNLRRDWPYGCVCQFCQHILE
jgi:GT2 family glycosyltransferase